jgi:hypothetical protein
MNEETGMEHVATERERMTKIGYERPMESGRMMPRMATSMNLGREKLPWNQEIWNHIDQGVYDECQRAKIVRSFIPLYGPVSLGELTVPSDTGAKERSEVLPASGVGRSPERSINSNTSVRKEHYNGTQPVE